MAIKTFTAGSVLTASDTNTYLANSGLVYVTESTLSATTNLNNIFTSSYVNYRLVVNTTSFSGSASNVFMQLTAGGTPNTTAANYSYALNEQYFNSGALVTAASNGANPQWVIGRVDTTRQQAIVTLDIFGPQVSQFTMYQSTYTDGLTIGRSGGALAVNTSYDGVRMFLNGTPAWGGTVRVYGYRQS